MCGRRSRARRCGRGGLLGAPLGGAGVVQAGYYPRRGGPITGVIGLVSAMSSMALDKSSINSNNRQAPQMTGTVQTNYNDRDVNFYHNTVPTYPVDQKKDITLVEPPAYTEDDYAQIPPPEPFNGQTQTQPRTESLPSNFSHTQTTNPAIQPALQIFSNSLAAYRNGSGNKRTVKRARKDLMNLIYETEIERRQVFTGQRLRCGEKSLIWNEVKDFGNEFWDMISEARKVQRMY